MLAPTAGGSCMRVVLCSCRHGSSTGHNAGGPDARERTLRSEVEVVQRDLNLDFRTTTCSARRSIDLWTGVLWEVS